jgi:hypothetical protein
VAADADDGTDVVILGEHNELNVTRAENALAAPQTLAPPARRAETGEPREPV